MVISSEDFASHNNPGSFLFNTKYVSALPTSSKITSSEKPTMLRISMAAGTDQTSRSIYCTIYHTLWHKIALHNKKTEVNYSNEGEKVNTSIIRHVPLELRVCLEFYGTKAYIKS